MPQDWVDLIKIGGEHGGLHHRGRGRAGCGPIRDVPAGSPFHHRPVRGAYLVRGGQHETLQARAHPTLIVMLAMTPVVVVPVPMMSTPSVMLPATLPLRRAQAIRARESGAVTSVRSWALLDTLLSSGLRASEGQPSVSATVSWATVRPRWWPEPDMPSDSS